MGDENHCAGFKAVKEADSDIFNFSFDTSSLHDRCVPEKTLSCSWDRNDFRPGTLDTFEEWIGLRDVHAESGAGAFLWGLGIRSLLRVATVADGGCAFISGPCSCSCSRGSISGEDDAP